VVIPGGQHALTLFSAAAVSEFKRLSVEKVDLAPSFLTVDPGQ
jgi:hypothetical protein